MPGLPGLLKLADKLNQAVGRITSFLVPLIGFIVLYEVIMRYAFNSPTVWVHDISQFLLGAVYFLGAGYTLMLRKHVNMDMIYVRLTTKRKAYADVVTGVVALIFLGVLVWQSGLMAWESVIFKEVLTQSVFEPPLYPIKIIFFIGCLLFLLQAIAHFIKDIITILNKTGNPAES